MCVICTEYLIHKKLLLSGIELNTLYVLEYNKHEYITYATFMVTSDNFLLLYHIIHHFIMIIIFSLYISMNWHI